jgi:Transposase DDE domain
VVCVPIKQIFPRPAGLSALDDAAIPVNYFTAWQLVVVMGALKANETVLIHSAGGGVGIAAMHIAKHIGARQARRNAGVRRRSSHRLPYRGFRDARWEHEHILEAVQRRLDEHPEKMRQRRETVEHPFGTIKAPMGATHFLMKTLSRVASEMALHVLAYNLTREHHGYPAAHRGDQGIVKPREYMSRWQGRPICPALKAF